MNRLAEQLIPKAILPVAQRIYWTLSRKDAHHALSEDEYLRLTALKCQIGYNKYGGYCVPLASRHRPAASAILAGEVYEPKTIEFLLSHGGTGDVIHAGTYFGDFLPALSRVCTPKYKVWAFEPNRENYRCARITAWINDIHNLELENAGLGSRKSTLPFRMLDSDGRALGGGSSFLNVQEKTCSVDAMDLVKVVTIDDVIPGDRPIRVIQLDVEGYEREALAGAHQTIRRWRPIIMLEVWPESDLLESEWFADNVLALGYSKSEEIHGNVVFTCTPLPHA